MDENSSIEKRKHLRLPRPYRVQARELVFPIAKDPLIDTNLYDISKGGVCIESQKALTVGTQLQVSVHIPLLNKFTNGFFKVYENDAEQYFQAIAEVSWVKSLSGVYLMGLMFINVDNELCNGLERLINKAFEEIRE